MAAWMVGHNVAGYLPELDELPAFASRDDAWTWLVDEARRYADQEDESAVKEDGTEPGYLMRTVVDAMLAEQYTPGATDWASWCYDQRDRQIVFWLRLDVDAEPDEEDE